MKILFMCTTYLILVAYTAFASCGFEEILPFESRKGEKFTMHPLHTLEESKVIKGLFDLFQKKKVYEFYERGGAKTKEDVERIYRRSVPLFKEWDRDNLGWMGILNKKKKFVGFLGGRVYSLENEPYFSICFALQSSLQRQRIITNAFFTYYLRLWPELKPEITARVTCLKATLNPRNLASVGFFQSLYPEAVDREEVFIPDYYKEYKEEGLPREKVERVNAIVPLEIIDEKAQAYKKASLKEEKE